MLLTCHVEDEIELVSVVATREEGPASEELGQDAADRPDVNGFSIHLEGKHDFRSAIPSRRDVFLSKDVEHMLMCSQQEESTVIRPVSPAGRPLFTLLARPKSHTLRSQFELSRTLAGLRSRCTISALCSDLTARRIW